MTSSTAAPDSTTSSAATMVLQRKETKPPSNESPFERECRAARERLRQTGYGCLARIAVSSRSTGHLRLEGSVPTFYMKQIAQETVLRLASLRQLDNLLDVARPPSDAGGVRRSSTADLQ